MTERMLITKLVRTTENRAELYTRGHKWPDLTLFDLSDLATVGLDYHALEAGTDTPCRFWAHWENSEKLNSRGNPYKDVIALEPIDKPATSTSTDNSALLSELRQINALLDQILQHLCNGEPAPTRANLNLCPKCKTKPCVCEELKTKPDPEAGEIANGQPTHYADGSSLATGNQAELDAFAAYINAENKVPPNVETLRAWVQDTPNPQD